MAILYLKPNGVGNYTNLSKYPDSGDNYEKVDDAVGSPDDDSTYVHTTSKDYVTDSYALENHTSETGTIGYVVVHWRAKQEYYSVMSPSGSGRPGLRLSGTDEIGNGAYIGTTYSTKSETISRPGGGDWSWDDIDNLEVIISFCCGTNSDWARCTQVYIAVHYASEETTTFTADALLQSLGFTDTFTADTIMVLRKDSTFDADAYIKKLGFLKTLTADCILWSGSPVIALSVDALFQKLGFTKTFTANMLIRKPGTTKTLTADVMLKKLGALSTFTADAMIQVLGVTKTFTADIIMLKRLTKSLTGDCIISKADVIKAFTASVMFYGMPEPCTLDLDFEHGGDIGIDFEQGGEIELIFLGGASG